ncbi:MAG: hypothetical protein WCP85_24725 [Mariniphaga sp.]
MKNYNCLSLIKTLGAAFLLTMGSVNNVVEAQGHLAQGDKIFRSLPLNLSLPANPQRYHITTDYYNHTLAGDFIDKIRVTGDLTTNLPGNTEKWNNVRIAKSQKLLGEFGIGDSQAYIENFTYQPSDKILQPDFFKDFPMDAVQVKNLVWDMAGIEAFAWAHLDSLKLNKTYEAKKMNGAVDLAGLGTFKNSNIQLTWKGISMVNSQLCGLIDFRAMDNPLEIKMKMGDADFNMKGRSHYWGTVYISLNQKVIEYTELLEDVTMEIKMSNLPTSQYVYTTRYMKVEKIK